MIRPRNCLAVLGAAVAVVTAHVVPGTLLAQVPAGVLERIRVHGPALEGNLSGDDATREVFVYLPPSYAAETGRRYPVVFFMHRDTAPAEAYTNNLSRPGSADQPHAHRGGAAINVVTEAVTPDSGRK
jgi:hypothetical protein